MDYSLSLLEWNSGIVSYPGPYPHGPRRWTYWSFEDPMSHVFRQRCPRRAAVMSWVLVLLWELLEEFMDGKCLWNYWSILLWAWEFLGLIDLGGWSVNSKNHRDMNTESKHLTLHQLYTQKQSSKNRWRNFHVFLNLLLATRSPHTF